ncbi:hypothetical protein [Mucilaginibacter sp.]|uniref:hypothetical protein n=1 Tax=Mucilaginibacter sp. TaxID=1882438 RepID=UPI00326715C2
MLELRIIIVLLLAGIFLQDLIHRAVYWFLFPLLAALFLVLNVLDSIPLKEILLTTAINFVFLFLQWLLVSAYFSLKQKSWVNITAHLLGWGDVLFLLTLCFYVSVLNLLFFYMTSLVLILMIWAVGQKTSLIKSKKIPLAGLQSLIFALYLALDWCSSTVNLTNDYWLLHLMTKWT